MCSTISSSPSVSSHEDAETMSNADDKNERSSIHESPTSARGPSINSEETVLTPDLSPVEKNGVSVASQSPPLQQLTTLAKELMQSGLPCHEFKETEEEGWLQKLYNIINQQSQAIEGLQDTTTQQQQTIEHLCESMSKKQEEIDYLQLEARDLKEKLSKLAVEDTLSIQNGILNRLENQINALQVHQTASQDESEQLKLLDSVIVSSPKLSEEHTGTLDNMTTIGRGRGRGCIKKDGDILRQPGTCNENKEKATTGVALLVDRIIDIKYPDDLQVQEVASTVKTEVNKEVDLRWFVDKLCSYGYTDRTLTSVVTKLFGLIAHHQAGDCKIRSLLMRKVQEEYNKRLALVVEDRDRFITSALFLGEIYHNVKTEMNTTYNILAVPVVTYLEMIIEPHLADTSHENVNDDMIVVSKLLLQSGSALHESKPAEILAIVLTVTEVLCRCQLTTQTRLNLLAALAELWPCLSKNGNINIQTEHASLAAKLGLSLPI
ncbi:uncharacterized protein [Procambarus clarkii]|uniref:uncharacterized protein isoform X1 n=2 Tax=Procambarus clarkii TaxID=6728 RepID=UPI003742FBFC